MQQFFEIENRPIFTGQFVGLASRHSADSAVGEAATGHGGNDQGLGGAGEDTVFGQAEDLGKFGEAFEGEVEGKEVSPLEGSGEFGEGVDFN